MNSRRNFLKNIGILASTSPLAFMHSYSEWLSEEWNSIDFNNMKDAYSLGEDVVYLNHGSIGTIPTAVHKAHVELLTACETNPWFYMWSGEWEEPREMVRRKCAELINVSENEIALSHNTTEVFNIMAMGLPWKEGDEVLFSNLNHAGASLPFVHHQKRAGFTVKTFDIPIDRIPELTKEEVIQMHIDQITPNTRLLVLPHIDNMVGLRTPVKEISKAARAKGVDWVALDTAQSLGMIPVDIADMDLDVMGTSTHKWVQTPKGVSFSYIRENMFEIMEPMWVSWGQTRWAGTARRYEDYGTRNLPEVVAMNGSLDFQKTMPSESREAFHRGLWQYAMEQTEGHPDVKWRSPKDWELSGSLFAIEISGEKATECFQRLNKNHGIVVRAFDEPELNTLRVSPNVMNTKDELSLLFSSI